MPKPLQSEWQLDEAPLTREEFVKAFQDPEWFFSNCQQIIDKRRRLVKMRLNAFQKILFKELFPLINPETRLDKRRDCVILKPRQVGCSVGMMAFFNYLLSYVEGIENFNVIHTFPATDTITKIYSQKVQPIITGVRPDIMPVVYKEPAMSSSIRLRYESIMNVRRNNYYDLVSANASSLRSGTAHCLCLDEVGFYRHPEQLEDAISPMLPAYGFSLVIYASTFDDKQSEYFKKKIITARDNPDDWTLIFVPFFAIYPEEPQGIPLSSLELTEYDTSVIMPAMADWGLPKELWGDAIDFYHRMSTRVTEMKKEYPTTLDEVLSIGENKHYFNEDSLSKQEKNLLPGVPYRLLTDPLTQKPVLQKDEASPFAIFKQPVYGRKYMITVDPITANNEDTDLFSAIVWDTQNNEQVATFRGTEMATEDYAEYIVGIAKIYNRAMICVEKNVAEGFNACVRARNYYNVFYENQQARAKRDSGIRTTVSSKPAMLDKLALLLDAGRIIIRDENTLSQLKTFEKRVKNRADGSASVTASAPKGKRDDDVACCWIYAGTLDSRALAGKTGQGFTVL